MEPRLWRRVETMSLAVGVLLLSLAFGDYIAHDGPPLLRPHVGARALVLVGACGVLFLGLAWWARRRSAPGPA
jgi:hypothetical protein